MSINADDMTTVYIIDRPCADRLRGLLEQLLDVFNEALARRRFDSPHSHDLGIEESDMLANVSSLLDDAF